MAKDSLKKIPPDFLISPGGIILIILAVLIEILDLIPLPVIDQIFEIPLEIVFLTMLVLIAKVPLKPLIVPFIIERIPMINDIVPTWFIFMINFFK